MITFRDATLKDDRALTKLVAEPMPGDLSLSITREPSLLQGGCQHGPPRRVLMAEDAGVPVAVCTYFSWLYRVGRQQRRIWTVADFRARRSAAGKSVTGLGWRALRERLNGEPALISVVSDNPISFRLFAKRRKGWPALVPVAHLKTYMLPLALIPRPSAALGLYQPGPEQIKSCLETRPTHLSPVLEEDEIGAVTPTPDSFLAGHNGVKIGACGALWDLSEVRQVRIAGYGGLYARLDRLSTRLGLRVVPARGSEVSTRFVAFLAGSCRTSKRRVFNGLLERAREGGAQFLVWGADAEEEKPFPSYWPHFCLESSLYQLKWDKESDLGLAKCGYEVAWL